MASQSYWKIVVLYHLIALTIDTTAMYGATVYFLFLFFVGLNFHGTMYYKKGSHKVHTEHR